MNGRGDELALPVVARVLPPLIRGPLALADGIAAGTRTPLRLLGLAAVAFAGVARTALDCRGAAADEVLRRRAVGMQRTLAALCRLHGFRMRLRGELPAGPVVIVANHVSYVDPLLIGAVLPVAPVAKQEIAGWPLLGTGVRTLGGLFVRRGDPASGARVIRGGLRALAAGVPVLGFPEGTTSEGHEVLPLRRGLFGLARLAGVPVVPVALRYHRSDMAWVGDASLVPHYLRTAARPESRADLVVGAPLAADGRDPAELAGDVRTRIARLLRS